jgi:uncharacterized protein
MGVVAGVLRELSAVECMDRLRHASMVGRLAFVADGRPMILPVNYVVDGDAVVFVTEPGTKLSAVAGGAPVAFEIDESRPLYRSGWSVVAAGRAQEISDDEELRRLRTGPLKPWAVNPSARWVRISIDHLSGRELEEG